MKKALYPILFFCCIHFTNAQNKKDTLDILFQKEFSYVVTGSPLTLPGNYAGINTVNNTLSASIYFSSSPRSLYSFGLSGGVSNNITNVFTEGELNSEVSISAAYHFIIKTKNEYQSIDASAKNYLVNKKKELNDSFLKTRNQLESKKAAQDAIKKLSPLEAKLKKLNNKRLDLEKKKLNSLEITLKEIYNDSIEAISLDIIVTEFEYNELKKISETTEQEIVSTVNFKEYEKNKAIEKLDKEFKALRLNGFNMTWVSLGYGATNNSTSLFDSSETFTNQLTREDYVTHNATASINFLRTASITPKADYVEVKKVGTLFVSLASQFRYTNNLSSLQKVEIVDTQIVSENPLREVNITQDAFRGDYEEDLAQVTTVLDIYKYLDIDNTLALHFKPQYIFRENIKPVGNMTIGVLVPFKDKEEKKANINIEFFYRINDVFNTTENENSLLNRNTLGVQVAFPFSI